jgi:transcriptional regulator with XRE-family HTH domain
MDSSDVVEVEFRKRLRAARRGRGLTQKEIADHLSARGIPLSDSIVAKMERGERKATLDEMCALADIFEMSLDTLLGRTSTRPTRDKDFVLIALSEALGSVAPIQIGEVERTLRERADELAAYELDEAEEALYAGAVAVADALHAQIEATGRVCSEYDAALIDLIAPNARRGGKK